MWMMSASRLYDIQVGDLGWAKLCDKYQAEQSAKVDCVRRTLAIGDWQLCSYKLGMYLGYGINEVLL